MAANNAPVEGKVWAGTVGGGAGTTISTFFIWLLGITIWNAPSDADGAHEALSAVPFPVVAMIVLVLGVGGYFLGGYLAKHTPRKDAVVIEHAPLAVEPAAGYRMGGAPEPEDPQWAIPAVEGESQEEYEERLSTPTDEDGDGRDDNNGRFVSRSE